LTDLLGTLPKKSYTSFYTLGILVIPPTNITSSILSLLNPESFKQFSQGLMVLYKNASVKFSNFALVNVILQCLGPVASAVKYGKFISV